MSIRYRFSDGEWNKVSAVLPKRKKRKDGKGRPPKDPCEVLEGILWILFSGAPWHMLPKGFPPYQTCHRYFQHWTKTGIFKKLIKALSLFHQHRLSSKDIHFIDGSFAAAKRGRWRRKNQAGKGFSNYGGGKEEQPASGSEGQQCYAL